MTATEPRVHAPVGRVLPAATMPRRPLHIVERNALAYRRMWYVFVAGFTEPIFYLLSIGIGVGKLVGKLPARVARSSTTGTSSRRRCSRHRR